MSKQQETQAPATAQRRRNSRNIGLAIGVGLIALLWYGLAMLAISTQ